MGLAAPAASADEENGQKAPARPGKSIKKRVRAIRAASAAPPAQYVSRIACGTLSSEGFLMKAMGKERRISRASEYKNGLPKPFLECFRISRFGQSSRKRGGRQ